MDTEKEILIFQPAEETARRAADLVISRLSAATRPLHLALSGGATALLLFRALCAADTDELLRERLRLWWVDERCVPPDHRDSNYGAARQALLEPLRIPTGHVFRMQGELEPDAAAPEYEAQLGAQLPAGPLGPVFDMIFLGMGTDGHTASLFPGDEGVFTSRRLVTTAVHPANGQKRLTLTPRTINNAGLVFFLVCGADKAGMCRRILNRLPGEPLLPAGRIRTPRGRLVWLLDGAAAAGLAGQH